MVLKIRFIHDFIAFIICLMIGVALTYVYPVVLSIALFILFYGFWLLITSHVMHVEHVYALSPRITRSSLASLLVLISISVILRTIHLEIRLALITFLMVLMILAIYIYYVSKHSR
ncbi:MAG: hypothetical protein QW733_00660 [Desulfurococcaceae archaeon]